METVKLKTLYDLLGEGFTAAQLASTIERSGVHGWDRYGRFGQYSPSSKGSAQALDALAYYRAAEERFWQELQERQPEDADDLVALDFPLDVVADWPTLELHKFGWPPDKVPAIDRAEKYPSAPRATRDEDGPRDALLIIGALLDFVARRQKPPSQAQIIEDISSQHATVYGLGSAALEKWFGRANMRLRAASPVKKTP